MSDLMCFETRDELRARQKQEHHDAYAELAQKLGVNALADLLPKLRPTQTWAGLLAGDEHLNNVPLHKWDAAAGCPQLRPFYSSSWPQIQLRTTARLDPWRKAPSLSLSERVCALKHVARMIARGELTPSLTPSAG